jgi:hypothetical protein
MVAPTVSQDADSTASWRDVFLSMNSLTSRDISTAPTTTQTPTEAVASTKTRTPIMISRTRSLPADPNEPSFLTTFPPEIRNKIYEELLIQDGPIEVPDRHDLGKLGSCITLLRSCRQIYNEASSTFYGRNDFVVAPGCTYLDRDGRFEHNSFGIWFTSMGSQICLLTRVIISDKVSRLGYAPQVQQVELTIASLTCHMGYANNSTAHHVWW